MTYNEIATKYAEFVKNCYGEATVVFDGYLREPSTKDMTHRRRRAKNVPLEINITGNAKFLGNNDVVLSSVANKERLIRLIGGKLVENGVIVKYSEADADIVLTAIKESENQNVVLRCFYMQVQIHTNSFLEVINVMLCIHQKY